MPRVRDHQDIAYSEKRVKGEIDRVIVELSGHTSAVYTRMSKKYKQIDTLIKKLQEKREELNAQAKDQIEELFDVEDEIYTRVIETVSLTLTLAKATPPSPERQVEQFDAEGFVTELYEMMPGLSDKLDELKEKYTKIKTIPAAPAKSPALRVKVKESKVSDLWSKLKDWAGRVASKIRRSLHDWDADFEDLRNRVSREF